MADGDHASEREERPVLLALYSAPSRAASLVQRLPSDRFQVISCPATTSIARWQGSLEPDIILLDPPDKPLDLVQTCAAIRSRTDRPIVVLSERSEELVITRALAAGVDDYLVEPIGGRELAARITAVLRRASATPARAEGPAAGIVLSSDDLSVDLQGRIVHLSPTEFRLLSCLASRPGKVFTHQTLMSRVWGAEYVDARHYLHVYVGYLREKLEVDPARPKIILNAWGVGYKFQPPDSLAP